MKNNNKIKKYIIDLKSFSSIIDDYDKDKTIDYIEELFTINYEGLKEQFITRLDIAKSIINHISKFSKKTHPLIEDIATCAAKLGDIDVVKYCINKGIINYCRIACVAALYNYEDIVDYVIKACKNAPYRLVFNPMYYERISASKYTYEKPICPVQNVCEWAAKGGNLNIIKKYFTELYCLKYIASNAIINGHLNVVEYLVDNGLDINEVLFYAIVYEKIEILKYFIKKGADMNKIEDIAKDHNKLQFLEYLK